PAVLVLALALLAMVSSGDASHAASTPKAGDAVPGRYIVVLRQGSDPEAFAAAHGLAADVVYRHALRGFAAGLSAKAAAALRTDPNVSLVEPDRVFTIADQTLPTGADRIDADRNATADIDGSGPDLDIDIAVIDTGVNQTHPDLNVAGGANFSGPLFCSNGSGSIEDGNGHGSHVSGTAAARDNTTGFVGVAPGARIWGVRVLNAQGFGFTSCIIRGIDWVTAHADTIEVANMSLGGPPSAATCAAIASSVAAGVIYAVAAGNESHSAFYSSPANCPDVISVSAVADYNGAPGGGAAPTCANQGADDSLASFSNFGYPVDIAAPGVCIASTYKNGGYAIASGTSMASPHVAGAVADFLLATGYSGSASGPSVVTAMTAAGYTTPQGGPCGFSGDPDAFHEPLVWLGAPC
ncbi:MAG TPA: S8 family serine peptidase, partial [Dehalococcoidia bacterium]|nr:S8 family serine peptidase [Dehalococcoidia bacterium]